jgi:hypothetical protein
MVADALPVRNNPAIAAENQSNFLVIAPRSPGGFKY